MISLIKGYKDYFINKKRVIPRLLLGLFNRIILKKPHLRVVEIATTFLCNSECVMCSCSKLLDNEKEKNRMSPPEYKTLGRQLDELGCVSVNITGGEPLMRYDIAEVITAVNPRNKIVNLITNGINLTREKIRDYKKRGIDSIVVSLESTCPAENDKIRRFKGHFDVVMRTMNWAREERVKYGISLTLGDYNFDKIYELMTFTRENGVFLCIAHGGSIGNWAENNSIFLSQKNADKILGMIKKQKTMKIDFSANLNLRPGCPAINEKIYITPYGDVMPCAFNPISFGNLRDTALPVIWRKMIDFYKKNVRGQTLCLRSYDKEYIKKYLTPIKDSTQPVSIEEHPAQRRKGDA